MTSLGTLQVHLEIIATTYRSTIFETLVLTLYSNLCIYIATHLHSIPGLAAATELESKFKVRPKMTIEWIQRYTPSPWMSEFGDAFGCGNRAYREIHLEGVIERTDGCTCRPWSCKLGGRNQASLDIHLEDMIELVRRSALGRPWSYELWRPQSTECCNPLWSHDRANLEAIIVRVRTSTKQRSMDGAPGAETLFIS